MSVAGTLLDRIVTVAEATIAGLTGERSLTYLPKDWPDDDLPVLSLFLPGLDPEPLEQSQQNATFRTTGLLVVRDETQEELLLKVEALDSALQADAVLNGAADGSSIYQTQMAYEVLEDVKDRNKAAVIEFTVLYPRSG